MTLIKSISGIRGTIGGKVGDNLTPIDVVRFAAAYGMWLKENRPKSKYRVVIGRDARSSGQMIQNLVNNTLIGMSIDVINLNLSTTPTVEIAVLNENADGGIIITASHNPVNWNALKLLNSNGEFLTISESERVLGLASSQNSFFSDVYNIGKITYNDSYFDLHIDSILELDYINIDSIRSCHFKVVVDGVNSSGGVIIPMLLERLGVQVIKLHCNPNGNFPHNPEPLKEHLEDLSNEVLRTSADFGIAVDPDVDRLAFMDEKGVLFGEEYTLVACADYVLSNKKGNTVSNLSSTRALQDITERYGCSYTASSVGEVNVVEAMKETNAIIGGEGNGGVILPELHYGRDALVGIALFLSLLAEKNISVSDLKKTYPLYFMSKKKVSLNSSIDLDQLIHNLKTKYKNQTLTTIDGLKIDFENSWIHLRKSNTEAIIRIYTEGPSQEKADNLANQFISEIKAIM